MTLKEDIRGLGDRAIQELNATHNYYSHSLGAWQLVMRLILNEGLTINWTNPETQDIDNEKELAALAQPYIDEFVTLSTFQRFVTLFEDFLFDILQNWLMAFPHRLNKKKIDFAVVLDAADKTEITRRVVEKELNELKYERVEKWFVYLNELVNLDCPTTDEIASLAEIKASRDILVHNRRVVNSVYLAKSGNLARYKVGELLEIPLPYFDESWRTIRKVIGDITNAAEQKA